MANEKNIYQEMEDQLGRNKPQENNEQDFRDRTEIPEYTPNSQDLKNTGQGAEAAVGTEYTWDKKGKETAELQYKADVLNQKQSMLNNRQTIENNGANYQAQADMMKYQGNQNAEKVGWTGGYVLDQNRQMDYLKASIQAQMYGAIELQKYGYDTSLAAARLSYDLNQVEYARQYYQDAVQNSMNEAQLTGVYFSAETKDMMSQLAVAEQKLQDTTLSDEEKAKAQNIKDSIYKWFSTNGVSSEGVKTLQAYEFEVEQQLALEQQLWVQYEAALQATKQEIANDPAIFIKYSGNKVSYVDGNVETINFSTMTDDQIKAYFEEGSLQSQQVTSYFNWMLEDIKTKYTKVIKDANGNETSTSNKQKIYEESKALDDRYFAITGQHLQIPEEPKKSGSGSEEGGYNSDDEWDFISDKNAISTPLNEMTNFVMYDGGGKEKTEDAIKGNHKNYAKGLQEIIRTSNDLRSCFFDFNDGMLNANHIYLYIDGNGNIYVISKEAFQKNAKQWYYLNTNNSNSYIAGGKIHYNYQIDISNGKDQDKKHGSYSFELDK